ncbi:MAG: hypothetical protein FJY56_07970 [Betaproteobacteria bacterium]|nr:hypothetical protein [Betaproteobacteria bacterium]
MKFDRHSVYRYARAWQQAVIRLLRRVGAALMAAFGAGGLFRSARARAGDEVARYQPMPGVVPASATVFGLYSGADFRLLRGGCGNCATPREALWYFRDEWVAVPHDNVTAHDFARGLEAQADVRRWYASATGDQLRARPPLMWIGAKHLASGLTLMPDDTLRFPGGRGVDFKIVPKLETNSSYYDDTSKAFLMKRALRMRGEFAGNTFTARTIWPQDWAINEARLHLAPLLANESLMSLVRRHDNARHETFEARLLWECTPAATPAARDWSGHALIAFILNGAQGDDDEAHSGHFAVITGRHATGGRHGARGDMADWMVNNFYTLASFSEKGITAAMLPLDNYLTDFNSGQAWYRPSYLLVAVLKSARAAYACQGAIARVYHHFYRQDFHYNHANNNCVAISMDTLRTLGWPIPKVGPTGLLKALAAYPYQTIVERSFTAGRKAYDYLREEQTRLFPAAAFDAAGKHLLRLAGEGAAPNAALPANALENLLREDLQALVFVRLPQMPSSRAFGAYPAASYEEYARRVPADKSQWKIVPVAQRPIPPELTQPDTLRPAACIAPWMPAALGGARVGGVVVRRACLARTLAAFARDAARKIKKCLKSNSYVLSGALEREAHVTTQSVWFAQAAPLRPVFQCAVSGGV